MKGFCIPYTLVCFANGRWAPIFPLEAPPLATGEGIWRWVADLQASFGDIVREPIWPCRVVPASHDRGAK